MRHLARLTSGPFSVPSASSGVLRWVWMHSLRDFKMKTVLSRFHAGNRPCIHNDNTKRRKVLDSSPPKCPPPVAFALFLKANKQGARASNVQAKYVYLSCKTAVPLNYYYYGELLRVGGGGAKRILLGGFAALVDLTVPLLLPLIPRLLRLLLPYKVFTSRVCPTG